LPTDHKYRKNKNNFFIGRVERDIAPLLLSGEEFDYLVSEYNDMVFGFQSGEQKFFYFGLTHNWVNQSIFLEAFLLKDQSSPP
jgi:hypothetical protein